MRGVNKAHYILLFTYLKLKVMKILGNISFVIGFLLFIVFLYTTVFSPGYNIIVTGDGPLVGVVMLSITFMLIYLVIHAYYEKDLNGRPARRANPKNIFNMILCTFFTGGIGTYMLFWY